MLRAAVLHQSVRVFSVRVRSELSAGVSFFGLM